MKGLIYPLAALAAVVVIVFGVAALLVGIDNSRRAHAIRSAKWEPFAEIRDGAAVIGVELVAHWGRKRETVRVDRATTETIDPEDLIARIQAQTRAESRAQSYNTLTT